MEGCKYRLNTGITDLFRCERGLNNGLVKEEICRYCRNAYDEQKTIPPKVTKKPPCKTCKKKREEFKKKVAK